MSGIKRIFSVILAVIFIIAMYTFCTAPVKPGSFDMQSTQQGLDGSGPIVAIDSLSDSENDTPGDPTDMADPLADIGAEDYADAVDGIDDFDYSGFDDSYYDDAEAGDDGAYADADGADEENAEAVDESEDEAATEAINAPGWVKRANVNMRSLPDIESNILAVLDLGTPVDALELSGGWYCIRYDGRTGYVRADMLTLTEPASNANADANAGSNTDAGPSPAPGSGADSNDDANSDANSNPDTEPNPEHDSGASPGDDSSGERTEPISTTQLSSSSSAPNSIFADACFIGHSFVVGMSSYFSTLEADFFGVNGISASRYLSYDQFSYRSGGDSRTGTINDVLSAKTYGKVYIMLGTNELGPESRHVDTFYNSICALIDIVRSRQPSAAIYLISIPPVSQSRSESSSSFNRANILAFNEKLKQAAAVKSVRYIDIFEEFADANGFLPASACSSDGVHILAREYARLKSVIMQNTV